MSEDGLGILTKARRLFSCIATDTARSAGAQRLRSQGQDAAPKVQAQEATASPATNGSAGENRTAGAYTGLRHNPIDVSLTMPEPVSVIQGNPSQRTYMASWCGLPVHLHVLSFVKRPNPIAQLPGPASTHAAVAAVLDAPPPVQANMLTQPDMVAVATEVEAALVQLIADPSPQVLPVLACAKVTCRAHIGSPGDEQVTQRIVAEVHIVTPLMPALVSLAQWLQERWPQCEVGEDAATATTGPAEAAGAGPAATGAAARNAAAAPAGAAAAPGAAAGSRGVDAALLRPGPAALQPRVPLGVSQPIAEGVRSSDAGAHRVSAGSSVDTGPSGGGGSPLFMASCFTCLSDASSGQKNGLPPPGTCPAAVTTQSVAGTLTSPAPRKPPAGNSAAAVGAAPAGTGNTTAPTQPAPAAPAAPRKLASAAPAGTAAGLGRAPRLPLPPPPPRLPRLPLPEALEVLICLAEALRNLHRRGVTHGALTPKDIQLQLPTPVPVPAPEAESRTAAVSGSGAGGGVPGTGAGPVLGQGLGVLGTLPEDPALQQPGPLQRTGGSGTGEAVARAAGEGVGRQAAQGQQQPTGVQAEGDVKQQQQPRGHAPGQTVQQREGEADPQLREQQGDPESGTRGARPQAPQSQPSPATRLPDDEAACEPDVPAPPANSLQDAVHVGAAAATAAAASASASTGGNALSAAGRSSPQQRQGATGAANTAGSRAATAASGGVADHPPPPATAEVTPEGEEISEATSTAVPEGQAAPAQSSDATGGADSGPAGGAGDDGDGATALANRTGPPAAALERALSAPPATLSSFPVASGQAAGAGEAAGTPSGTTAQTAAVGSASAGTAAAKSADGGGGGASSQPSPSPATAPSPPRQRPTAVPTANRRRQQAQRSGIRAVLSLPAVGPAVLQLQTWGRSRPAGLPRDHLLWCAPELLNTGLSVGPSLLSRRSGNGSAAMVGSIGACGLGPLDQSLGCRGQSRLRVAVGAGGGGGGSAHRHYGDGSYGGGGSLGVSRRGRALASLFLGPDPHIPAAGFHGITPSCDVYSLGMIMWYLVSGHLPLRHLSSPEQVLRAKEMGALDEQLPFSQELPMSYIQLARRCWSPLPMQRPSMPVVLAEMRAMRAELLGPTHGREQSHHHHLYHHWDGHSSAGDLTADSRLSFTLSLAMSSRELNDDYSLVRPPLELAFGAAGGEGGGNGAGGGAAATGLATGATPPPPPPPLRSSLPPGLLTALTAPRPAIAGHRGSGGGAITDDDDYTDTDRFTDHIDTEASNGTMQSSPPTVGTTPGGRTVGTPGGGISGRLAAAGTAAAVAARSFRMMRLAGFASVPGRSSSLGGRSGGGSAGRSRSVTRGNMAGGAAPPSNPGRFMTSGNWGNNDSGSSSAWVSARMPADSVAGAAGGGSFTARAVGAAAAAGKATPSAGSSAVGTATPGGSGRISGLVANAVPSLSCLTSPCGNKGSSSRSE